MFIAMALSAGIVIVLAYLGVGRPLRYVELSFAAAIAAGVVLLATPTPLAYTSELRATRPGGPEWVQFEQVTYHVLFLLSVVFAICAAGFHRPTHDDVVR